ncbi:MAG: ABC transporter permease [Bdellovibrionia bacterium]
MSVQILSVALLLVGGLSVLVSSWSSYQSLSIAKEHFYHQYQFADIFVDLERAPTTVLPALEKIQGVSLVESRIVKMGLVQVPEQVEPALGQFVSWSETKRLNQIHLKVGRLPQAGAALEAVVHEAFAEALKLSIDDELIVNLGGNQRKLVIVGIGISPEFVYALSPVAPLPDDKHFGIFWIHEQHLQYLFNMKGVFNSLLIGLQDPNFVQVVSAATERVLSSYGGIEVYGRAKQMSHMFVEDEISQQKVMAIVLPAVFMSVALFILNIILSRMITFHRPQIATLKALGYQSGALVWHYFELVTVILLFGIIPAIAVGAAIGYWYADLYKDFFRFPVIDFSVSLSAVLIALICGLVPGWLSAAYSLLRVLKLNPAEALRPPSPPSYRKNYLENLIRYFDLELFTKMIIRSLFKKPLRMVMGLLGLSLSISILIAGSFWTDVINGILDYQFQKVQREDLAVALAKSNSRNVMNEVAAIKGVLNVEGERILGAQILLKDQAKEIVIKIYDVKASMTKVTTEEGLPLKGLGEGAVISSYFKTIHQLKKGDIIKIKLQEGAQKVVSVPILDFSKDILGHYAYVDAKKLSHWLLEPELVNSLKLKIDPDHAKNIFIELKKKPEVVSVSIRESLLNSFNDLIGDMILTFTFILYLFALGIAGAVIYNSAHISFSEKNWELASLRILGFDVGATFEIIFFEVGIQVLIALIPGLFLGYFISWGSTQLIHNESFSFPFIIEVKTFALAVFVFLLTFFASGFILYRKVTKLDFSKALKARE